MAKYDLIVVLGSQPDLKSWKFPQQSYDCLERAKQLFDNDQANSIAVCGKWSIAIEAAGLTQPFMECDALADYLISHGVPSNKIIKEDESKDTISNLYFLKINYLIPLRLKWLIFVVVDFRIPRLQFLCQQILGNEYKVAFKPIAGSDTNHSYNEPHTTIIQKEFLKSMEPGDHAWLADKFYSAPIYDYWMRYNKEHPQHLN